ncbi:MAG: 50S ribosomal protein L32 [Brevinemataceae bacterium]
MGVPKKKTSKCHSRIRRSNSYYKMDAVNLSTCSDCGAKKLPHRVCSSCGMYKGRQVVAGVQEV